MYEDEFSEHHGSDYSDSAPDDDSDFEIANNSDEDKNGSSDEDEDVLESIIEREDDKYHGSSDSNSSASLYAVDNVNIDEKEGSEQQDVTSVTHKRKYSYLNRKRGNRSDCSMMRKRWKSSIEDSHSEHLRDKRCCKKLDCFSNMDISFLQSRRKVFLSQSKCARKQTLYSMLSSDGSYYFNGNKVFGAFLRDAFHFSRDMQSAIKHGRKSSSASSTNNSSTSAPLRLTKRKTCLLYTSPSPRDA